MIQAREVGPSAQLASRPLSRGLLWPGTAAWCWALTTDCGSMRRTGRGRDIPSPDENKTPFQACGRQTELPACKGSRGDLRPPGVLSSTHITYWCGSGVGWETQTGLPRRPLSRIARRASPGCPDAAALIRMVWRAGSLGHARIAEALRLSANGTGCYLLSHIRCGFAADVG